MMKFFMSISNNHSSNCMFAGREVRKFADIGSWCIMYSSSTMYEFLVIKEQAKLWGAFGSFLKKEFKLF